jgi:hypothetical protein
MSGSHGEVRWLFTVGGAGVDTVTAVAAGERVAGATYGDVIATGVVGSAAVATTSWGTGAAPATYPGPELGGHGAPDGFVALLAGADGRPRWIVPLSATGWVLPRAVSTTRGRITVTGLFAGTLTLGTHSLTDPGGGSPFTATLNPRGQDLELKPL